MDRGSRSDLIRLLVAVVLAAVGVVCARVGFGTESTLAVTWFGAAVLAWVLAAAPAGPLPWRTRGGFGPRSVVAPVIVGAVVGVLLGLALWGAAHAGLAESVRAIIDPWRRVAPGWALVALLALAATEELALRHGVFALLPRPARILGTMALSAVAWWVIGNELTALGAVVISLACARQRWVTRSVLPPLLTHVVAVAVVAAVGAALVA